MEIESREKRISLFMVSIFTLMMVVSGNTFAKNRITGKADPAMRCQKNIAGKKCAEERATAVTNGCITKEESESLRVYGAFPQCSYFPKFDAYDLAGWCSCGCFDPDTSISAIDKASEELRDVSAYEVAHNKSKYSLVNVEEGSSLTNIYEGRGDVIASTEGEEVDEIIVFNLEGEKSLKLTQNHPIMTNEGILLQAKDIKVDMKLLDRNAREVSILSIEKRKTNKKVVNFTVEGKTNENHLIFAENIVVGDLFLQGSIDYLMNELIMRK